MGVKRSALAAMGGRRLAVMFSLGALFVAVSGCERPEIRIPQLEAAQRVYEEPRQERSQVYQKCLQRALQPPPGDQDVLMRCMRDHGYGFLAKAALHRTEHCRKMYDASDQYPEDYCFQKTD